MTKKIAIIGTGRCGTKTLGSIFKSDGLDCCHEHMYNECLDICEKIEKKQIDHEKVIRFLKTNYDPMCEGKTFVHSNLCLTYMIGPLVHDDYTVIWLVRDPIECAVSFANYYQSRKLYFNSADPNKYLNTWYDMNKHIYDRKFAVSDIIFLENIKEDIVRIFSKILTEKQLEDSLSNLKPYNSLDRKNYIPDFVLDKYLVDKCYGLYELIKDEREKKLEGHNYDL